MIRNDFPDARVLARRHSADDACDWLFRFEFKFELEFRAADASPERDCRGHQPGADCHHTDDDPVGAKRPYRR